MSAALNGQYLARDATDITHLSVRDATWSMTSDLGIHVAREGALSVDANISHITSIATDPSHAGRLLQGVYDYVEDDKGSAEWRVCWAPAGRPRPINLESAPGSGNLLLTWRRADSDFVVG